MDRYNLVSFSGMFVLMGVAWLFSPDKKNINWRAVLWGTALQLVFALFVFKVPVGTKLFLFLNEGVVKLLEVATAGAKFVFGLLAFPPGTSDAAGNKSLGFFLAFQAFPTIIFFSALVSILYYYRLMPLLIRGFAYIFSRFMRVSGAESLVTASNIFAGVESTLTIRPYLANLTESELCTLLTAGMATVSSNVMAVYVFSLQKYFPTIAGHLLSASVLSAPAAILMSKLILPEKGEPTTLGTSVRVFYEKEKNLFEAIINGANAGVRMIVGIVALLIAVLGLVSMIDLILHLLNSGWSLKLFLGYLFYPFTLLIGVPPADAGLIARIVGERAILTEIVSYQDLAAALAQNLLVHPRSAVIAAYALCGFAHVASLAIFIGGTTALAPNQTGSLAKVGWRALIAATLACLMTAGVAGVFFSHTTTVLSAM
ncbi:MAG: nucleoside transporter [Elusimicrobia bacterium]|nr:nucleoside transporter [Elusimicrobiota bacterium]